MNGNLLLFILFFFFFKRLTKFITRRKKKYFEINANNYWLLSEKCYKIVEEFCGEGDCYVLQAKIEGGECNKSAVAKNLERQSILPCNALSRSARIPPRLNSPHRTYCPLCSLGPQRGGLARSRWRSDTFFFPYNQRVIALAFSETINFQKRDTQCHASW